MKYLIFDRKVEIILQSKFREYFTKQINQQFSLYPQIENNEKTDIKINIVDRFPDFRVVNKTGDTQLLKNGFVAFYHKCIVAYLYDNEILQVYVKLKITANKFIKFLKKINNIEFENIEGRINNILFELVLTPAVFFFQDLALIHSSGFEKDKKGVLLGGKGGVGKTSLSMKLCSERDYNFVNDDIAVIDYNGNVYPNLAFPKIYGYNLVNNSKMKELIFQNRNDLDKIVWKVKKTLLGKAKVRRKISPKTAYGTFYNEPCKLSEYNILERIKIDQIRKTELAKEKAVKVTIDIILHEFGYFIQHLKNYEILCEKNKIKPILELDIVLKKWQNTLLATFAKADCYNIQIPAEMDHQKFIIDFIDILNDK